MICLGSPALIQINFQVLGRIVDVYIRLCIRHVSPQPTYSKMIGATTWCMKDAGSSLICLFG